MACLISVIVPAYNEEKNIRQVVDRIKKAVLDPLEIIVVDDGSDDGTCLIAGSIAHVILLKNEANRGKGYSYRQGIERASGEIIVFLDGDLQDLPEDIPSLLDEINRGADFVIASKFIGQCRSGSISGLNIVGNKFFSILINLLFRSSITDSQSGFKAIRKEALKKISLVSDGYEIETEMLIRAIKSHLKITEVPTARDKRFGGQSKFRRIKYGLRILRVVIGERLF